MCLLYTVQHFGIVFLSGIDKTSFHACESLIGAHGTGTPGTARQKRIALQKRLAPVASMQTRPLTQDTAYR